MSEITLSKAVRSNLLNLQSTAELLSKSQERLSTGLRVNSALDNPTNFFTAQGLNSRANDLSQLLDAVSNAVQTVAAADKGISAITKLVESAQATARQALQTASTVSSTPAVSAIASSSNISALAITAATSAIGGTRATGSIASIAITATTPEQLAIDTTSDLDSVTIVDSAGEVLAADSTDDLDAVTIVDTENEVLAADSTDDLDAVTITDTESEVLAADSTGDLDTVTITDTENEVLAADSTADLDTVTITGATAGTITINGESIVLADGDGVNAILSAIQGGQVAGNYTVSNTDGVLTITAASGEDLEIGGDADTLAALGLTADTTNYQAEVTGNSGTITINGQNISITAGMDTSAILGAINGGATAGNYSVSNTDGVLTITADSGEDLEIGGDAATLAALGLTADTTNYQTNAPGNSGTITINGQNISITAGMDTSAILGAINGGATAGNYSVSNTDGVLTITADSGEDLEIGGNAATLAALGLTADTTNYQAESAGTAGTVSINGYDVTLTDGMDFNDIVDTFEAAATTSTGSTAFSVNAAGGTITFTSTTSTSNLVVGGDTATLAALGIASGTANATPASAGTAGSFTINGQTVTLAADDDATDIVGKIQSAATASSGTNAFTASYSGGVLTITGTNGNDVVIDGLTADQETALGLENGTTDGTPPVTGGANPKRQELLNTYNDLLGQIDALAKDASFNGVNLLNGDDLSVLFNEDGSSKLDIAGVDNSALGLGLTALADGFFNDNADINATLDTLKAAIDTLRSQASKFGSNLSVVQTRQDFTKNMINVLQTGASNLTLADTNEEAANVLALQTRQQLSSTALSLASQADQNVLRLF